MRLGVRVRAGAQVRVGVQVRVGARGVQRVVQLLIRELLLCGCAAALLAKELLVRLPDALMQVGVEARHVPSDLRIDGHEAFPETHVARRVCLRSADGVH